MRWPGRDPWVRRPRAHGARMLADVQAGPSGSVSTWELDADTLAPACQVSMRAESGRLHNPQSSRADAVGLPDSPWKVQGEERRTRVRGTVIEFGQACVRVPPGAAVQVAESRDGTKLAAVIQWGTRTRAICLSRDGTKVGPTLTLPVCAPPCWGDADEVVLVVERWPSRAMLCWRPRDGAMRTLLGRDTPGVVETVVPFEGGLLASWANEDVPRVPVHVHRAPPGGAPWMGSRRSSVRIAKVLGSAGTLPCLIDDPPGHSQALGTVVLLHGGPNGAHFSRWSPLVRALADSGWRVVRPNLRGSLIRERELRPPLPDAYGSDDLDDVEAVVRSLGVGPVVVGGVSYGGYLATRGARRLGAVGAFSLSGFLSWVDLADSAHPVVKRFLRDAPRAPEASCPPRTRCFIAHGLADDRIPADAVAHRCQQLPDGSELVMVPGEGHGIVSDEAALRVYPRLLAWLRACIENDSPARA